MRGQCWCPSEIRRLAENHTLNEFYFAATMDRHDRFTDHSRCSEIVCLASQVDDKTYQTKHTTGTCCCKFIGPLEEQLYSILNAGGNSVARLLSIIGMNTSCIEVVDSRDVPYTAISQVWADGLGNAVNNKLPICQLREIKPTVTAFRFLNNEAESETTMASDDDRPCVWIDTFCVPLQSEK
jgi:hypothetical protein